VTRIATMNEVSSTENLFAQRLNDALRYAELRDSSIFALGAEPYPAARFPTMFPSQNSSLVDTFDSPPAIRRGGFDLDLGGESRVIHGEVRRATVPGYGVQDLWQDGMLIYALDATVEPCWGSPTAKGELRVNPLALIEPVYLFAELSKRIYTESTVQPQTIFYRVLLRRLVLNGKLAGLPLGPLSYPEFPEGGPELVAPDMEMERSIVWEGRIDSEAIAYRLVREIYFWFGASEENIPFTKKASNGEVVVDPEILVEIGNL
jgi:hypothetical protein